MPIVALKSRKEANKLELETLIYTTKFVNHKNMENFLLIKQWYS